MLIFLTTTTVTEGSRATATWGEGNFR